MTPPLPTLLAMLLVATPLTGCLGSDDGADEDHASEAEQIDELADEPALTAEATLEQPAPLPVGRWFSYTLDGSTIDTSWTAAVVADGREGYEIRVDDPDVATYDAMWEWVMLGVHDPSTLAEITRTGERFDYLRFPLYDGAQWSSTWALGEGGARMDHVATFVPEVPAGDRTLPGYRIDVVHESGELWRYHYVPQVGFLTDIGVLDPDSGEQVWRIAMTAWGDDYTGPYFTGTSEHVVDALHEVDLEPSRADVMPNPRVAFDVSTTADRLYVAAGAYASAGVSRFSLSSPDGDEIELLATSTEQNGAVALYGDFVDPVPGTWEATIGGAGLDTEGWIDAWETTLTEHQL